MNTQSKQYVEWMAAVWQKHLEQQQPKTYKTVCHTCGGDCGQC